MVLEKESFLRVLKGAPLSVLLALFLFGPANKKELRARTGWKREAVDDAVMTLEMFGLVDRLNYRKWVLSDGWEQLGLFEVSGNSVSRNNPQLVDNLSETSKNSTSAPETSKNSTSALVVVSRSKSSSNSELLPQADQRILDVCAELGIYGKKRHRIASLRHVVNSGPDYVRDHVAAVGSGNVALAIWRIEAGWPAPGLSNVSLEEQVPSEWEDIVVR